MCICLFLKVLLSSNALQGGDTQQSCFVLFRLSVRVVPLSLVPCRVVDECAKEGVHVLLVGSSLEFWMRCGPRDVCEPTLDRVGLKPSS